MVLAGNESELDRSLRELIARQEGIDKRVERLESLEGTKWDDGRGCLSFEDSDQVANASPARVDVIPTLAENGDLKASQAILFWQGAHRNGGATMVDLYMTVNNHVGANYYYTYKYTKGGALTQVNPAIQNRFFVGRIGGIFEGSGGTSYGRIIVPFYSNSFSDHHIFGDWSGWENSVGENARQEKGEYSGFHTGIGALRINRFDFFPAAGDFANFIVYLYLMCPQITGLNVPDD
jgi:hypothetical protein